MTDPIRTTPRAWADVRPGDRIVMFVLGWRTAGDRIEVAAAGAAGDLLVLPFPIGSAVDVVIE